jgi:cytoskeletal protein CcmA (bactofilin family)
MIFGKKTVEEAGAANASAVAGGKSMEERRSAASQGARVQGEDARNAAAAAARGSRPFDDNKTSTLSSHLNFEGNLKFSGKVIIDCEFRGSVVTDDTLVVGPSGKIEAELSAGVVEVAGKVRGNIKARTKVRIVTGGEVHGNVETPTIAMDEGVIFEGNCTRPQDARQSEGLGAAQAAQLARVAASQRKAAVTPVLTESQPTI